MTELTYMPYQLYLLLVAIDVAIIYYSFTNEDTSYYTDIITSLLSAIVSGLIAYNSIIGIGIYTDTNNFFVSKALMVVFGAFAGLMVIFMAVKILELGKQEVEQV